MSPPPPPPPPHSSRRRRRIVTLVGNVCEAAPRSLFWVPQRIPGSVFRISFHPDWQIDNGIFNRPIIARTQILVHRWSWNKGFGAVSQTDCGTGYKSPTPPPHPPTPPPPPHTHTLPRPLRTFTNGCLHHFLLVRTLLLHNALSFV